MDIKSEEEETREKREKEEREGRKEEDTICCVGVFKFHLVLCFIQDLLSYSVVWTSVAVSFSIVLADIGNEF